MKTTNVLLGLIVILLTILALLQLRQSPKSSNDAATSSPIKKYQYADFEFQDHVEIQNVTTQQSCLMIYGNITNADGSVPKVQSNLVYSTSEIMQSLDKYGWEVVWGDGKEFLVRRPTGQSEGDFIVGMSDVTNSDLP